MFRLIELYSRLMVQTSRLVLLFHPQRTPVVFTGAGAAGRLSQAIAAGGNRRILVVTDRVLVELGLVASVTQALQTRGVDCAVYDGILPDPTAEQIDAGVKLLQQDTYDAVLAIGGGSSLDAAKIIALQARESLPISRIAGFFKVKHPGLPLFAIPTTAGTGSEATMASVITDSDTQTKVIVVDTKLTPQMAALDTSLMLGMPPPVTAATGIDALTHALESYLSVNANEDSRHKAAMAMRMIFGNLPTAYTNGDNAEAREAMAIASFLAGSAFTQSNVGYVHAIAHQLGALFHIPHGVANALALPHVLAFYRRTIPGRLAEAAQAAGLGKAAQSDEALAELLVERVGDLIRTVGIAATLEALREDDCDTIVRRALKEAHGLFGYPVPAYMRPAECRAIVQTLIPEQ